MKKAKLLIIPVLSFILAGCGNGTDSAQQEDPSDVRIREDGMMHDEHMMDEAIPPEEMHEEGQRMHGDTIHDDMMHEDGQRMPEDTIMHNDRRREGI